MLIQGKTPHLSKMHIPNNGCSALGSIMLLVLLASFWCCCLACGINTSVHFCNADFLSSKLISPVLQ